MEEATASSAGGAPGTAARYPLPEALRGLSAIWVVLFHLQSTGMVSAFVASLPPLVAHVLFTLGPQAVSVFFVLSGFFVARSFLNVRRHDGLSFMTRRLKRLTPTYYASLAMTFALVALMQWRAGPVEWGDLTLSALAHMVYAQGLVATTPLSFVYWMLALEIQFYLVVNLVLWFCRRWPESRLGRFIGLCALFGTVAVAIALHPRLSTATFLPFWPHFAIGIAAGWAARKSRLSFVYPLLVVTLTAGALVLREPSLGFAVVASLIILSATAPWLQSVSFGGLPTLGGWSYSLYLAHYPVIVLAGAVLKRMLPDGAAAQGFMTLLIVMLSVAAAAALHRWVEAPSIRWSRRQPVVRLRPVQKAPPVTEPLAAGPSKLSPHGAASSAAYNLPPSFGHSRFH